RCRRCFVTRNTDAGRASMVAATFSQYSADPGNIVSGASARKPGSCHIGPASRCPRQTKRDLRHSQGSIGHDDQKPVLGCRNSKPMRCCRLARPIKTRKRLIIRKAIIVSMDKSNQQGSKTRKAIVLVHGGFVDGSGWAGVYKILNEKGYKVVVVQNPTKSLAEDVAFTKAAIDSLRSQVVLVG